MQLTFPLARILHIRIIRGANFEGVGNPVRVIFLMVGALHDSAEQLRHVDYQRNARSSYAQQPTSSCIMTSSDSSSSSHSINTSEYLSLLLCELTARSRIFCACSLHRAWKRSLRKTFFGSSDVWLPVRKRSFAEAGVTGER